MLKKEVEEKISALKGVLDLVQKKIWRQKPKSFPNLCKK